MIKSRFLDVYRTRLKLYRTVRWALPVHAVSAVGVVLLQMWLTGQFHWPMLIPAAVVMGIIWLAAAAEALKVCITEALLQ